MRNRPLPSLFALFLLAGVGSAHAMPSHQQFLEALDTAPAQAGSSEKELTLTRVEEGRDKDSRRFKILDNSKGDSLVEFLDPTERGQKVLSTSTEMWFLGSGSRRAIKVPPINRLFGDASLGDIARLNLARDYKVAAATAETDGEIAAWRLTLEARDDAATYSKVLIWLRQSNFEPLRAHYFLASGKHAKSADFLRNQRVASAWSSQEWVLSEPGQSKKQTRLTIGKIQAKSIPDVWFTPRHLEMQR